MEPRIGCILGPATRPSQEATFSWIFLIALYTLIIKAALRSLTLACPLAPSLRRWVCLRWPHARTNEPFSVRLAGSLHPDRVIGRHRHHRRASQPAAAGRAESPRDCQPDEVRQQFETVRPGLHELSHGSRGLSPRRTVPSHQCGLVEYRLEREQGDLDSLRTALRGAGQSVRSNPQPACTALRFNRRGGARRRAAEDFPSTALPQRRLCS